MVCVSRTLDSLRYGSQSDFCWYFMAPKIVNLKKKYDILNAAQSHVLNVSQSFF